MMMLVTVQLLLLFLLKQSTVKVLSLFLLVTTQWILKEESIKQLKL